MASSRLPIAAVCLGIAHLTAACGDTGTPNSGGAAGNNAAGQATAGSAGALGGGSGGAAAGSTNVGGGNAGAAGSAGSSGMGGSMIEPEIPGGPDESIPADPGEMPFIHPLFTDH